MDRLVAGLAIENTALLEQVRACLEGLPVRVLVEKRELDDRDALVNDLHRARPDVILVELSGDIERVAELVNALKSAPTGPAVIALQSVADPEAIVVAMRAGATEYLYPPLEGKLRSALDRISAMRADRSGPPVSAGARTLAFFSAKGGCGATTIACHMALEFQRQTQKQILLADFDMDAGMVRFFLKTKSPYSVLDAASNVERLDLNFWKALISNGTPRLEIIQAPQASGTPPPAEESLRHVLRFARSIYDWILVDLGRSLNSLSAGVLDEIDESFVVTTLDVPALYQAKQVLQKLIESGYGRNRLHVLLNRMPRRAEVTVGEVERMLGVPIYGMLPDEHGELYEAYAGGTLVPRASTLGTHFARLASRIAGVSAGETKGKRRFSLF
jgi:pilus assembly protein CpaE